MTNSNNNNKAPPAPPPLPLSQTENGALATAPLSTVVNAATHALYQDLYDLVHGEIKIVSVVGAGVGSGAGHGGSAHPANGASSDAAHSPNTHAAASVEEKLTAAALGTEANGPSHPSGATPTYGHAGANAAPAASAAQDNVFETRKERMANLSFAQRRHELSKRLVRNAKSLSHVYALAAASLPKSHAALQHQSQLQRHHQHGHLHAHAPPRDHPPPRLGASVQASSDALRFVRAGWVAQDEAQDALYFHHDGLWKARGHCHDVLGALCVLSTPFPGEVDRGDGAAEETMPADGDASETAPETEATDSSKRRRLDADAAVSGGGGRWPDFPTDVALAVDRYEISREKSHSPRELKARLACAVRRKLVSGEVGRYGAAGGRGRGEDVLPWKVVLEKGGGSVRLTYGTPKRVSTAEALRQRSLKDADDSDDRRNRRDRDADRDRALRQYPMEARLSVLSEHPDAPWKLLSVHVRCAPKTGESDHQLGMNRKQMFDLHRIGERAMIVEEAIWKKRREQLTENGNTEKEEEKKSEEGNDGGAANNEHTVTVDTGQRDNIDPSSPPSVPRPLHRLFEVTHSFALSLQLEMLSSQAEALRRGAWGGAASATRPASAAKEATGEGIAVSPAFFFDGPVVDGTATGAIPPIAVMAVHFWSCDDRYGSPKVGDLSSKKETGETKEGAAASTPTSRSKLAQRTDDNYLPKSDRRGEKRLSLCIRAVPMVGLVVSLSGGSEVAASLSTTSDPSSLPKHSHHVQRNVKKLLSSIQDPFQLSMSDALLAATVLCAEKRCHAVVAALKNQKTNRLPTWIHLDVECGSISVAASISYVSNTPAESTPPCILFRLACDSRTGRFVPSFPRSTTLLRLLACNDGSASDIQSLRTAAMTSALRSGSVGRKGAGGGIDGATREFTGRIVRDAFDALSRAVDTLGRRCGVGGEWNDVDAQSASLRERSVVQACRDVRLSLMTCSGIAAVFGVAAIGLKVASGADPVADGAGGPIDDPNNPGTVQIPPLSVHLRQRIVEKVVNEGADEPKRISILEGELLAVTVRMSDENLELICYDVLTATESAQSVPMRLKFMPAIPNKASISTDVFNNENRPSKRRRTEDNGHMKSHRTLDEVEKAALWFDSILNE